MLFRFSLYGFLKNQRYFEPFIVLFFLSKGLTFSQIGLLVAFRELFRNLLEIPSGSFADLYGRKFALIISFSSYIISFLIFSICNEYYQFYFALFFFGIADAFRTGTHKAIIFDWLRKNDRISEKTKVYGFTRSWSKIGSAVSILIATVIMLVKSNYDDLFLYAVAPSFLGLVNILSYPKYLNGGISTKITPSQLFKHFSKSLKKSIKIKPLRNLMYNTMTYEGMFAAFKDYLQPVINSLALALPVVLGLAEKERTAIIIGIVYFVLYSVSAVASRKAHIISNRLGSNKKSSNVIWRVTSISYLALIPLLYFEFYLLSVFLFSLLYLLQNVWRPIQISRFDEFADEKEGAAILSIESQAKSFATMIFAPVLGFLADLGGVHTDDTNLWLLASACFLISLQFIKKK